MFASTYGATEVIAATLQRAYSKTTKKPQPLSASSVPSPTGGWDRCTKCAFLGDGTDVPSDRLSGTGGPPVPDQFTCVHFVHFR